jgi:hypothetical protein
MAFTAAKQMILSGPYFTRANHRSPICTLAVAYSGPPGWKPGDTAARDGRRYKGAAANPDSHTGAPHSESAQDSLFAEYAGPEAGRR